MPRDVGAGEPGLLHPGNEPGEQGDSHDGNEHEPAGSDQFGDAGLGQESLDGVHTSMVRHPGLRGYPEGPDTYPEPTLSSLRVVPGQPRTSSSTSWT